jgi:tetratricopeptide (TPR) repeat protein
MRKVLAHLKGYKEIKTKHFLLKYDEKADPILGPYVADYLEQVYEELAKKFNYRPAGPFLIELFRTHEMFSGRTVALPDLHTIGACTGRVVTLVSPNEKNSAGRSVRKPFNWARVLRHEVVHLFNLAQTDFLVPHWFTEGLAVSNEGFPRPPSWNKMLAERAAADKLLTLDNIDLAFIRPRDAMEWQQAYCQAQLYVEYITATYKGPAIGQMLAAFAKGAGVESALKQVCKVDKADFEKGYKGYLNKLVGQLRGKANRLAGKTTKELQADHKKAPGDADTAAELAVRLVETAQRAEARKLAEDVLEKKPTHAKANYVLAVLAKRAADTKQEKALLEKALDRDNPEPLVLKALGKIYYDAGEHSKAADLFELGRKQDRSDPAWLQELARTYAQMDSKPKQISVLKDLVPLDADDFDRRVRLARLLADSNDSPGAEKYAREALEINVTSKEAQGLLFKALEAQGGAKKAELTRLRNLLTPPAPAKGK